MTERKKANADRPVDSWRRWAAEPLPLFNIVSTRETPGAPLVWTLEENGNRVAQWREDDVPGLGFWMANRLAQLHGAWHVARTALATIKGQSASGDSAAERQRDKWDPKREALRTEAARRWAKKSGTTIDGMAANLASDTFAGYSSWRVIADLIRDLKPKATPKK